MQPQNSERGTVIGVIAIILGGVVAGVLLGRQAADSAGTPAAAAATPQREVVFGGPHDYEPRPATVKPQALSEADLAKLGDYTMSGSAASRLAAIERLSLAPRDQALPPLKHVLLNGDPATDRPAALLALKELALAQGDGDGRIRDAIRDVIYHGGDDDFAADAQEAIDIISGPKPE